MTYELESYPESVGRLFDVKNVSDPPGLGFPAVNPLNVMIEPE